MCSEACEGDGERGGLACLQLLVTFTYASDAKISLPMLCSEITPS